MIRRVAVFLAALCVAAVAQAQPSISSVSCTAVRHGEVCTISGTGFGTKPAGDAPEKYSDWQNLSNGQSPLSDGWDEVQGSFTPDASNARLRPNTPYVRNMRGRFQPTGGAQPDVSNYWLRGRNFVKGMGSGWMYFDTAGATSQPTNVKFFRWHVDAPIMGRDPNIYPSMEGPNQADAQACSNDEVVSGGFTNDGNRYYSSPPGSGSPNGTQFGEFGASNFYNVWVHILFLWDAGDGGDAPYDGDCIVYVNGIKRFEHLNIGTTVPGQTAYQDIAWGNYIRSADWSGNVSWYWESVLIDDNWARVEISTAATYGTTTREQCIVISWSSTVVTCTLVRGGILVGTGVYFHVVTDANVPSTGNGPHTMQADDGSSSSSGPRGRMRRAFIDWAYSFAALVLMVGARHSRRGQEGRAA